VTSILTVGLLFKVNWKTHFFRAPNATQHLPDVWGAIFGGDIDLDRWPTFRVNWKTRFFVPRMPHNTCQTSGVPFSEVTSTFTIDLLFRVNWKTCFLCPECHTTLAGRLGAFFGGDLDLDRWPTCTFQGQLKNVFFRAPKTTQLAGCLVCVFWRWPWPWPLTYFSNFYKGSRSLADICRILLSLTLFKFVACNQQLFIM
jgi:hypothetical protein